MSNELATYLMCILNTTQFYQLKRDKTQKKIISFKPQASKRTKDAFKRRKTTSV